MKTWWLWFIMAAALAVGELFTAGFFLVWFAVGAAVAGVMSALGLNAGWQWGSFVVVSGILLAISRKFAERVTKKQPPGIGADRFIEKKGVVLEEIDNMQNKGRVRIGKDQWRADSLTDEIIPAGVQIRVVKVDGTHLIVERVNAENNEADAESKE